MRAYRPGEVADLLGVSVDTVRRWADAGRLQMRRSADGRRSIDGAELARFLARSDRGPEVGTVASGSARNRMPGIVTRVVKDKVAAQVEIQAGPHRIVSLMTREAADELALQPGVMAVATIKATNVVVELPAS